jgi:hypothetical protein
MPVRDRQETFFATATKSWMLRKDANQVNAHIPTAGGVASTQKSK